MATNRSTSKVRTNMSSQNLPDDVIRNILISIRNLDLLKDRDWLSSNLATRARRNAPDITDSQILRTILTPVLEDLRADNENFADLLHGRYWEGLTIQEMIDTQRPGGQTYAERSLRNLSKLARGHLARHLLEHEQSAGQQPILAGVAPSLFSPRYNFGPMRLVAPRIGVVLAIGFISWISWSQLTLINKTAYQRKISAVIPSQTPTPRSLCNEHGRATAPATPIFLRNQGVSSFTSLGTGGYVQNNKVRAVAIDKHGLWAGFFATESNAENGLSHYNKQTWANCDSPNGTDGKDVNDIAIDPQGRVWVAAEKKGVAMYDGASWRTFTENHGLPSADTFGLAIDPQGRVWVATWDGVATFDGSEWSTPFTTQNGTLTSDHTGSIAFDSMGDIWVGLLRDGVNRFRHTDGSWDHLTKQDGQISGNEVRSILVRRENGSTPESVWIATNDGGISSYERGVWSHHTADSGLPSNSVNDLALDRYNRIWAATSAGVSYYTGTSWMPYTTLPSLSIALGPDCTECPYDNDHVIVGTVNHGITHSRIPLDTDAIEVISVSNPSVVSPGEAFIPEITIAPKAPYKLTDARGDFLSNTDEDDSLLFGTHEHMAVKGTIDYGAQFVFREPDLPFIAPPLPDGINERSFTSTWRMWMHTRYVGPPIHITFTVRRNSKSR